MVWSWWYSEEEFWDEDYDLEEEEEWYDEDYWEEFDEYDEEEDDP